MHILLVEDDELEVMKFKKVVGSLNALHLITHAGNGMEALSFFKDKSFYPDIILLDINMPVMSGIEFLKFVRAHCKKVKIPIIMFSTSNNYKEVFECYNYDIGGYIVKPLKHTDYILSVERLVKYWEVNTLGK